MNQNVKKQVFEPSKKNGSKHKPSRIFQPTEVLLALPNGEFTMWESRRLLFVQRDSNTSLLNWSDKELGENNVDTSYPVSLLIDMQARTVTCTPSDLNGLIYGGIIGTD